MQRFSVLGELKLILIHIKRQKTTDGQRVERVRERCMEESWQ